MEDMTFAKKLLYSLVVALAAAIVAGITLALFAEEVRSLLLVLMIVSLVIGGIVLVLLIALDSKSKKIKGLAIAGAALVALIAVFSATIMMLAPKMIFPRSHDEEAYENLVTLSENKENYLEQVACGDLTGWRLCARNPAPGDKRPVILCFGGNGQNSSSTMEYLINDTSGYFQGLLVEYDFVFFDYPGYGTSAGNPNGDSLREMALSVFDEVESWSTTSSIVCLGYSIGTGPATYCASQKDADGLVLWAPYANQYDVYNNYFNVFHGPLKLLVTYKMTSDKYIKDVDCPILIVASDKDEVIPYESSRNLFAASTGGSTDFTTVQGIGHNDFWSNEDVLSSTVSFVRGVV